MPVIKESSQFIFSSFLQAPDHPTALTAIDKIFSLNYAYLRPFFVPAWSIFGLLKQRSLIEREGLQIEIETFLQETDRGILFLEGKAGTGKTTFLARWVAERGAIQHFFETIPNQKSLLTAKANLAAQLIRLFELADFMPEGQLEKEIHSPDLIKNLMEEGSKARILINPDQKICIVIDGLDHLEISQDTGTLGLPEILPENVYLILSKSPDQKPLTSKFPSKIVSLDHTHALFYSDMRKYCQKVLENYFSGTIDKQNKVDQINEILLEKARGNWIHLNHLLKLLDDLEISRLRIEELWDHLPDNLFLSYLQTLIKLKDKDHVNWYRYLLPVLGVLAAVSEPITLPRLALEAGIQADFSQLKNHIEHSLSPLLSVDDQERYQFNHLSVKELLTGNFQHGRLSPQEEAFFHELVENSRLIHLHLAKDILSFWGGLEAGLPALKDSVKLTAREEYGLDNLFTHLEKAGSTDDLRKLLNLQWQINETKRLKTLSVTLSPKKKIKKDEPVDKSQYVNAWFVAKRSHNRLSGYREDLQKAWMITNSIGDQVRLALMRCSIETISSKSNQSPILDGEEQDQLIGYLASCLAESGEIDEAFAAIEMIHSDHWKSQALARVASYMPSNSVPTILRISQSINDPRGKTLIISNCALHLTDLSKPVQALEIAGQISGLLQRNKTLSQLSIRLMENNQSELALDAIHKISDESTQVDLITHFARQFNRDDLQVALTMIRGFKDDDNKVQAINGLASFLSIPLQRYCFQWIQQIDESTRSRVLIGLLPHIHESLVKDGLAFTREIKDENLRAPVLVELIIRTAATGNPGKALKLVPAILGEDHIAAAIVGIAPYLTEEQRFEAYEMGSKIKEEFYLGRVQEGLIPFLSESDIIQILEKVSLYKNNATKTSVLTAIIKRYHVMGEQVKSLEIIQNCPSRDMRARLLVEMAPLWSEELKKSALAISLEIESDEAKAIALLGLLPYLQKSDLNEIKAVAVELPEQGWSNINSRSEILISIGLLLVAHGEVETALSILNELQDDESLAKGIQELIPVLPNSLMIKAFGEMRRIQNTKVRIILLGEIAPNLPAFLIDEFLTSLKDEEEWVRLEAVNRLAPHIPIECLQNYMQLLLEIHDQNVRSQSLTTLVKKWLVLPVPESLSLWKETIQSLSNQPRPDFLVDLAKLTPVINDLGGVVAVKETLQAVKDVATWWN